MSLKDEIKEKKTLIHCAAGMCRTMKFIIGLAIVEGIEQGIITKENYLKKIQDIAINAFICNR